MNPAKLIRMLFLAGWLPLVALSGCATLPPVPADIPAGEEVGQALLEDWLSRRAQQRTVQGVAKVRMQSTEKTVNGTQVILVEAPDRLRAETLSPFGAPLLLMAADGSELGVLLPADNLFYQGRATPENLGRFIRLPFRLADLVGILLARPPLIAYRQLAPWRLPDGGWRLELEAGLRRQELLFDGVRRLRQVRYLSEGELQLQVDYGSFDSGQADFPRTIELELPRQSTHARLNFTELAVGLASPAGVFTLQPPAGATVVRLDELSRSGEDGNATGNPMEETAIPSGKGDRYCAPG